MIYKTGELLNNRYEILDKIGEGSTARIYSSIDRNTGDKVALKISKDSAGVSNNNKRFIQEAELLLKLDNPNIVKAYEVFDDSYGQTVIVMEYLSGEDLDQHLKSKVHFQQREAVEYVLQIMNALRDLHAIGTMHRDLKPQNVFVTVDGKLKLMDFGIAQVSEDQGLTRVGSVIGTVGYMAPELLTQKKKANAQTEIYSLGVMLYKMLIGALPYTSSDDHSLALKILHGGALSVYEMNNKIDKPLSDLVGKMMAHDYVNRYETLDEVERDMNLYLIGELKEFEPVKKKKGLFRKRRED